MERAHTHKPARMPYKLHVPGILATHFCSWTDFFFSLSFFQLALLQCHNFFTREAGLDKVTANRICRVVVWCQSEGDGRGSGACHARGQR